MNNTSENNKRIAKNTLFLYFRQILVMAVSLYTVRVVLAALGEEDYGIYNVEGGFVAMFNILSGHLCGLHFVAACRHLGVDSPECMVG